MQRLRLYPVVGVLFAAAFGLSVPGCAKSEAPGAKQAPRAPEPRGAPAEGVAIDQNEAPRGGEQPRVGDANKVQRGPVKQGLARKIIYTANVRLIVEDFGKATKELEQLIEAHKGYVLHAQQHGAPRTPRSGEWKIRVPVEQFRAFQAAVVKLGELQNSSLDSQDVTEEFYDLKARLANRKAREVALRKMYEDWAPRAQKPADLMPIDQELDAIRKEIERAQGRLQLLSQLSELTTVTVFLHERGAYVPPETATLGTRAGRTFGDSLEALRNFAEGLLLCLIALAPWLPVLAFIVVPAWIVLRRQRAARPVTAAAPMVQPLEPSGPPPSRASDD